MPAPYRLRQTRASAIRSADDTSTDPTGAPSPFDRQTETVSKFAPYAASGTPLATWAFQSRAPSRCIATPTAWVAGAQGLDLVERLDRAAAEVVGVLHRDRPRSRPGSGPAFGAIIDERDRRVQRARDGPTRSGW